MKASLLASTLEARFHAGIHRAAHIQGPPGCGKTQIVQQLAARLGVGFKAIHPPTMMDEDFGMPRFDGVDSIQFIVSKQKFPLEHDCECAERGILLVDELPQASNNGQKILANIFQERTIHEQRLKPGWMIVSTGNRVTDRAGANRLLSHVDARLTTYDFDTDLNDWATWYLDQPDCRIEVVAFIRFREAKGSPMLIDFDPQRAKNPSPRAWVEGVGAALGKVPPEAEFETFKGDVGEGAAAEFVGFLRIFRSLPDPDIIIMDPKGSPVPTDTATQYALAGALGRRATRENFAQILTYSQRMPPEMTVLTILDSKTADPQVVNTKAFQVWASGPGAKLLGLGGR